MHVLNMRGGTVGPSDTILLPLLLFDPSPISRTGLGCIADQWYNVPYNVLSLSIRIILYYLYTHVIYSSIGGGVDRNLRIPFGRQVSQRGPR